MADQNKQDGNNRKDQNKNPRKDINQKGGETSRDMEDDMTDMSDLNE